MIEVLTLLGLLYLILIWKAISKAFYSIKHPSRCMSWILVIIFLPLIGLFFYYLTGRSVKKDRYFQVDKPFNNIPNSIIQDHPSIESKQGLAKMLESNKSSAISYSNSVSAHLNGPEIFQRIKEDIANAKRNIHLDFYIVECGELLNSLHQIFEERLNEGVKIRLVYDGFGTRDEYSESFKKLERIGVEIKEFMPYSWIRSFDHVNYRNHRKMIIIDSLISYTGGMNISDKHIDGDPNLGVWRDTYVRIVGKASYHMNLIFQSDWYHAGGSKIELLEQPQNPEYKSPVQIISNGPDSEYMGILHQYFMMIMEAQNSIKIATPYFVPGEAILTALKTKALSGVNVELMMPNDSDSKWMKWTMFSFFEDLLKAGVKIWIYHSGFLHNKVLISDDVVCSVGTANVDERSFYTNFEVNAVIYDRDVVKQLKDHYEDDKDTCELLDLNTFNKRVDRNRFLEALARLTSPLL